MKRTLLPAVALVFLLTPASPAPAGSSLAQEAGAQIKVRDPVVIDAQGYKDLLARHKGKPVLVNFWATWCPPCRKEYPALVAAAKKYAPQGVVVIGVSMDEDAEMELVRGFLERHAPPFANYRQKPRTLDEFRKAVDPRWTGTVPATFSYGRDGRLIARRIGEQTRESFEKAFQELLAPAAGSR